MRRLLCLFPAWLLLAILPIQAAEQQSPSNASTTLPALIQQLADPSYLKREEALRLIKAKGVDAIPILTKALSSPVTEIRRTAQELLPVLKRKLLLTPTRVTLYARSKTVKEVLAQLSKQTGYELIYYNKDDVTRFSIDLQNIPFWKAMEQLCHKAGLVIQPGYSDTKIRLIRSDGFSPFVRSQGLFRFAPSNISEYRSLNLELAGTEKPMERHQSLSLSFHVYSEPRLPILGTGTPKMTMAVDNEGESMLPVRTDEGPIRSSVSRYGNGYLSLSTQVSGALKRPSGTAERIKLIRGTVPLTLLTEKRDHVVTDQLLNVSNKKITISDTEFQIEHCKLMESGEYRIKLRVTCKDTSNVHDYSWLNSLYRRIHVEDGQGKRYQNSGNTWHDSSAQHVSMTFTVYRNNSQLGKPARLIFSEWQTMEHAVPFELRDLPLP